MLRGNDHGPATRLTQGSLAENSVLDTDILPPPEFLKEVLQNEKSTAYS